MLWVWIILGLAALFIGAVSLYGASEIVRIPYLATPYVPKDFGLPCEEISFPSHDGLKLVGWFIPAPSPSSQTIFVLHGLGSNAGDMLLNALALARTGKWNVFFVNFRGHGGSEGHLTSLGPLELRDFESALEYITKSKPDQTRRLAVYGHSLGAAVAIVGAARHKELEGVAAESPFARTRTTISYFATTFYGIPAFPFMYLAIFLAQIRLRTGLWGFEPIKEVGKLAPRPLLIIHAERDQRMPLADTMAIMAAAGEPKELWVVPGAGHGEPWIVAKDEFESRLVGFFNGVFK